MTDIVLCYAEEQNLYPPKVGFTDQARNATCMIDNRVNECFQACWAAPGLITCWRSYVEKASDKDMAYSANHEIGHLAGCWGEEPPLSCMLPIDERCI
jgi:hypothetical protein